MALKEILQQAIKEMGWDEEIEYSAAFSQHFVTKDVVIENLECKLEIGTKESLHLIFIDIIYPVRIDSHRSVDAAVVLNAINCSMLAGHVELHDGVITYRHCVDVENVEAVPAVIINMLSGAVAAFGRYRAKAIAALVLTSQSAVSIVDEFEKSIGLDKADNQRPDVMSTARRGSIH